MSTGNWQANILYVSHRANLSGAPISLMLLARGMQARGHRVGFAAPRPGPLISQLAGPGIELFYTRGRGMWKHAYARSLTRFLRQGEFQLVHTNTLKGAFGARAARRCRRPLVWHIREDVGEMNRYKRGLVASLPDVVIVPSKQLGRDLENHRILPPARIRVIANGIDVAEIERLAPAEPTETRCSLGIPTDAVLVGLVGTVKPRKGIEYFIRAAAIVCDKQRDVFFVLVGDPFPGKEYYYRRMRRLAADLKLRERLLFLRARPDVLNILKAVDIVVLPSLWEGMSRVILEAMALARPVIATRVGGNPELVRHGQNGALVPPRSPHHLADWLLTLCTSPHQRDQWGRAGKEIAQNEFSLTNHVHSVETLYRHLLTDLPDQP